jgi:hypothetical protein
VKRACAEDMAPCSNEEPLVPGRPGDRRWSAQPDRTPSPARKDSHAKRRSGPHILDRTTSKHPGWTVFQIPSTRSVSQTPPPPEIARPPSPPHAAARPSAGESRRPPDPTYLRLDTLPRTLAPASCASGGASLFLPPPAPAAGRRSATALTRDGERSTWTRYAHQNLHSWELALPCSC